MIHGLLELLDDRALDAIVDAVFRVLAGTGMHIYNDDILAEAAAAGAEVDRDRRIARFPARMVEDTIALNRRQPYVPPRLAGPAAGHPRAAVGMLVAPFWYDYDLGEPRPATTADLINSLRFGDIVNDPGQGVTLAVTRQDVPAMWENVEAYALQLENTANPGGVWCNHVAQMPYVLEINRIWFGDERHFFPAGIHCVTSPLTMGLMMSRFALYRARHGVKDMGASVMPISGANAPVTAAGNVVVSVSEILGAWTAMRALVPDARLHGGVVGGSLDMRRGAPSFNSPEALLQDAAVCEVFRRRLDGNVGFAGGTDYIEATVPGLAAAWEKVWCTNAAAAFAGSHYFHGGSGALDAGRCFSPEQLLIEQDLLDGLWRFGDGVEVNAETLATDVIAVVGAGEGRTYTDTEHTLANYRTALWQPRMLSRELWGQLRAPGAYEKRVLDQAHERYLAALKQWQPPAIDADKMKMVWEVVARAKVVLGELNYGD
ncbi:MAG: trimethylamine methyltransferase family protein [Anaerolineae bacterium]